MKLLPDWKRIASRAWSIRLMLLAGLLSGVEFVMQTWAGARPRPWLTLAAGACTIAATIARIVAQPRMRDGDEQ